MLVATFAAIGAISFFVLALAEATLGNANLATPMALAGLIALSVAVLEMAYRQRPS